MYRLMLDAPAAKRRAAGVAPRGRKLLFEIGAGLLGAYAFATIADYVSYLWDAEAWITDRLYQIGREIQEWTGVDADKVSDLNGERIALEAQLAEIQDARRDAESNA